MIYKFVFAFLRLLSRLPFWFLHGLADVFFVLLYYVIGYRRKVIMANLAVVFPENTLRQNKKIARKFTRHFADFLIESLKTLSISEKALKKRYMYKNNSLIMEQLNKGKSVVIVAGHYGNWEWISYFAKLTDVFTWAAYAPLTNRVFDRLMVNNRQRYGFTMVPSSKVSGLFRTLVSENKHFVNCLLADQSPQAKYKYRTQFLGQDVPFYIGTEVYAKKYNLAVFYGRIKKIARSKYVAEMVPITINAPETPNGWITSEYIRLLEKDIREEPAYYLWSHRRFKHATKKDIY